MRASVGDIIVGPFETREDYCKRILGGEGIEASNTTTTATSELINQTESINNNNNSTEGELVITEEGTPSSPCIVITEEGMPSGPSRPRPEPQPNPSPKPC